MAEPKSRRRELEKLSQLPYGRDRIADIYRKLYLPTGQPEPSLPVVQIIALILDAEIESARTLGVRSKESIYG